jgi:hypothetical protein
MKAYSEIARKLPADYEAGTMRHIDLIVFPETCSIVFTEARVILRAEVIFALRLLLRTSALPLFRILLSRLCEH